MIDRCQVRASRNVEALITHALGLALVLICGPAGALEDSHQARHPLAIDHPPAFITSPGETDVLLVIMAIVLVGAVLAAGVFFFWLHSLPERLVHNSTKVHLDLVAALALLSLFTHVHLFWVAALLIALVRIPMPDFTGLLGRIAAALERIAGGGSREPASSAPDHKEGTNPTEASGLPPLQGS